ERANFLERVRRAAPAQVIRDDDRTAPCQFERYLAPDALPAASHNRDTIGQVCHEACSLSAGWPPLAARGASVGSEQFYDSGAASGVKYTPGNRALAVDS